jgi:thiol-disulfide isomerase/thioredoxin
MKTKNIVTTLLALALASAVAAGIAADGPALEKSPHRAAVDALHGKPAPALKLKNWENSKALTLADLKGKIGVLDFWATWCGPCLAAVPHTNELMKKYADRGVVIIGVCAVNGSEKMAATVKSKGIKYPVAIDDDGQTAKAYLNNSFPDYYVIDQKGNLRWGDINNKDVELAIETLLKE